MVRGFGDKIITSIDIGTTKICVLVAQHIEGDALNIVGIGTAPSTGLRKGVVVDIAQTVTSIKQAVKEAELMSGITIQSAHIGISGSHISSRNSHGMISIKKGVIQQNDIQQAIASAQAIPIDRDHQILHVLPQYFIIDGRERINNPLGMHGVRLEVQTHIIMGAISSVHNLVRCCQEVGIEVTDLVLEQLASADAVLSNDERELGVAMLDIGGGTADLAIYQQGTIRHTMVLPVAGNHVTNDIAVGLRITLNEAERIKKQFGMVGPHTVYENQLIEVELVHGKDRQVIQTADIVKIIEPRIYEMMALVRADITQHHMRQYMPTGMVLTGGGSLLRGIDLFTEQICACSVRIGKPTNHATLPPSLHSPIYATAYGLLIHALKKQQQKALSDTSWMGSKKIFERMRSWVVDLF